MPLSQTTELQNRYNKITEIFLEVLEKEEAERGNFLSTICDGDNDLRLEVEKLIKDSQEVKTFLSSPLVDLSSLVFNQLEQDFLEQDFTKYGNKILFINFNKLILIMSQTMPNAND